MKNIFKNITALGLALVASSMVACNDFEEINVNPTTTTEPSVLPHFLMTRAMFEAQQDPHIAERIFIIYWNRAARFATPASKGTGSDSQSFNGDYLGLGYLGGWINAASQAVKIANDRIEAGTNTTGTHNIAQISRIWRAYLFTEYADNFGPSPIEGFQGVNPTYSSQQATYEYIISELADAVSKLDHDAVMTTDEMAADLFFACDTKKWEKYANSMIMRLAMRISSAAPAYAQAQFEAAAADMSKLLTEQADIASVKEGGDWNASTGVMTRPWNQQYLSLTMANLTMGLGGIELSDIAKDSKTAVSGISADDIAKYSKDPATYLGFKSANHLSDKSNVDNVEFFMDYMPSKIDPRTMVGYSVPLKENNNPVTWKTTEGTAKVRLTDSANDADTVKLRTEYTYFGYRIGDGGLKSTLFRDFTGNPANFPLRSKVYRDNVETNKRVFFGPWETYFLIAEAAVKGWATPMSAEAAYEAGITSSFTYYGLEAFAAEYLRSEDYNMVGTSVKFSHTSEIASRTVQYYDLEDNLVSSGTKMYTVSENPTLKTMEYKFPKGVHAANNDALTKIITQKYIAQSPWLPSEAWADYRRLCLPFFENPLLENKITTMPNYTDYTTANPLNIGQRSAYPTSVVTSNREGYAAAISDLKGGVDDAMTPLWWAYGANN